LPPESLLGRRFTGHRKVRLGDADRTGRLRLDGLTRYTQDVSDDDTTDAGLADVPGWVVRSTVVDELIPARLGENLTFVTFCSGLGKRWAERRLSVCGDLGARYEVATLWVCIDPANGRPHPLTDQFIDLYGAAADGRTVSARLNNPKLSEVDQAGLSIENWPLRAVDYDVYDHVNNAAYWALVEQWCGATPPAPRRIRMEYGQGLAPADMVAVARITDGGGRLLWWLSDDPEPAAVACVSLSELAEETYPR
jgi:acyl-ACP thioesterase